MQRALFLWETMGGYGFELRDEGVEGNRKMAGSRRRLVTAPRPAEPRDGDLSRPRNGFEHPSVIGVNCTSAGATSPRQIEKKPAGSVIATFRGKEI